MALKGTPSKWEAGTKIAIIRDALQDVPHTGTDCKECKRAARSMYDLVGIEPLIFKTKVNGVMTPLPKGKERWQRFLNLVREVHAYIASGDFTFDPSEDQTTPEPKPEPRQIVVETNSEIRVNAERFYSAVQNRRGFVRGREKMEQLDSMRIVIDGVKAIIAGLPVEALVSSIEAPWTAETRVQAANFRATASDLKPHIPVGTYDYSSFAPRPSTFAHATSEYVLRLATAGVPIWLHGPAGTGKSSAAKYAAEQLGLEYYEVNLAGAMVSAVKGKDRLKEFVESDFIRAYEHGGLVCLEEFDSAHPSVGTALNTALAGDEYHNDADGRTIKRNPNFRCVVTANSLGYGSAEFKRNDLDAATKDRFRMGRVYVALDLELERSIFESILSKYEARPALRAA